MFDLDFNDLIHLWLRLARADKLFFVVEPKEPPITTFSYILQLDQTIIDARYGPVASGAWDILRSKR